MNMKIINTLVLCFVIGLVGELHGAEKTGQEKLRGLGGRGPHYTGRMWSLQYGSYEGVEQFAVNELQRMVQRNLPYVLEILPANQTPDASRNLILVGTPAANPKIAELGQKGLLKLPTHAQGYTIACLKSPWQPDVRVIVVAGTDSPGVLYGAIELNKKLATISLQNTELREAFDALPEFSLTEAPVIENRGIWTWGYAIYDYQRFLDNMARLKMNRLTVWHDYPPVNCRQFVEYAHSRGIKVILGFSWGWGHAIDPTNPEHLQWMKDDVLRNYEDLYKDLGMDGIYFQTFTEQFNTTIGGRSIAGLACDWVNDIARALLEKHPDLRIEWGLHAISIRENYLDLKKLDPRLTIVWEDVGGIPYSYDPEAPVTDGKTPPGPIDPDATIDYSKKLATFRPGSEFAMCAKGWTCLRVETENGLHGPFIIGQRSYEFIHNRMGERQLRWDYVNAKWMANYPIALRFYSELREVTPTPMTVVGLIEDGMFEERIQVSAALLGETLWNPKRDKQEVLDAAMTPYYRIVE